ncbi:hypothetical protein QTG54_003115 [Skeletonema marinoi]|uniref:Phosphatidic acid phosphatase type 2/haloperoxidase domain-containing protein n=1 Tax=Skeletonema marinoi TaxID=267567 RepID=A0AAD8YI97_9STRA|nr:hypothetical protein QTG54_003115 [Skeletonema marinoi]
MTITTRSIAQHESEWIYSTFLTKQLNLSCLNDYIHQIPHVPLIVELYIFMCGYAFNPTMVPLWLGLVNVLTRTGLSDNAAVKFSGTTINEQWGKTLLTIDSSKRGLLNMTFYLATVLVTLLFTELGKASFATTRPKIPTTGYATILNKNDDDNNNPIKWKRRFGSLVASLKSKHSFPSGDSSQAMNLCLFFLRYVPTTSTSAAFVTFGSHAIPMRDVALFSLFLPGVVFARVFYLCHWIEDCIGGVSLSLLIHWLIIPILRENIVDLARSLNLI